MSTEVLYRKYRPHTFDDVVGQDGVVRTLKNAIATDKVAHAYLFSGPRGTGKTTTGRILAKAVNCRQPSDGSPCGDCPPCSAYDESKGLDLIELDAASNRGIDEIRSLREKATFAAAGGEGARKVYLIDEVHMLTEPAFNALLKTLEEPPEHVIFVLATTEAHKVPATVVSRCQRFDFRRITADDATQRLRYIAGKEEITCPEDGLDAIARLATGSLRDAINLLEQVVDSYGKEPTFEQVQEALGLVADPRSAKLSAHGLRGELKDGLALITEVRDDGIDLRQFQRQVVAYLRATMLTKAGAPPTDGWSKEQLGEMQALVADLPEARTVDTLRAFGEADLRADPLSPLPLELALASCALASEQPIETAPSQPQRREAPTAKPSRKPKAAPQAGQPENGTADAPPIAKPQAKPEAAARSKSEAAPEAAPAASRPTPQAAPMSTKRELTPEVEEARKRWQEIYERTRELQYRAGALLNSGCGIIGASDKDLVIGFRHAMLLERMQGDGGENLRALQQALDDVLGAGRTVRVVHDPDVDVQRPNPPRGGHLVRAAEELGGEVLPNDG